MDREKTLVSTREEVVNRLIIANNDENIPMETVEKLLGMKWIDSHLPQIKGAPEW
jgi:hypothetical protein